METLLNQSCGFFMPNAKTERLVSGIIADFPLQRLRAVSKWLLQPGWQSIISFLKEYILSSTGDAPSCFSNPTPKSLVTLKVTSHLFSIKRTATYLQHFF